LEADNEANFFAIGEASFTSSVPCAFARLTPEPEVPPNEKSIGTTQLGFVVVSDVRAVGNEVGDTKGTRGRSQINIVMIATRIPDRQTSTNQNLREFCWISKNESIEDIEMPSRALRNVYQSTCFIANAIAPAKHVLSRRQTPVKTVQSSSGSYRAFHTATIGRNGGLQQAQR